MKLKLLKNIFTGLIVSASCFSDMTYATLTFTVNVSTSDMFSASIYGTIEPSPVGTGLAWITFSPSTNFSKPVNWVLDGYTESSQTVKINGVTTDLVMDHEENSIFLFPSDSIFAEPTLNSSIRSNKKALLTEITVEGYVTIVGKNAFNPAAADSLELISGFTGIEGNLSRLEATGNLIPVPESSTIAFLVLGIPSTLAVIALGMMCLPSIKFNKKAKNKPAFVREKGI